MASCWTKPFWWAPRIGKGRSSPRCASASCSVPMFFSPAWRALFVPLAEAVVFAMAAYILAHRRAHAGAAAHEQVAWRGRKAAAQRAAARLPELRPPGLSACAWATRWCCRRCWPSGAASSSCSWRSASCPAAVSGAGGATLPDGGRAARSACTSARPRAPASRRPRAWPTRSRR